MEALCDKLLMVPTETRWCSWHRAIVYTRVGGMSVDFKPFQAYVQKFSAKHGWHQNLVDTRLCFLMTEVGEPTQAVLQSEHRPGPEQRQAVDRKIFEVIWNAVDVANRLGLDITECFHDKMAIHPSRQWSD